MTRLVPALASSRAANLATSTPERGDDLRSRQIHLGEGLLTGSADPQGLQTFPPLVQGEQEVPSFPVDWRS